MIFQFKFYDLIEYNTYISFFKHIISENWNFQPLNHTLKVVEQIIEYAHIFCSNTFLDTYSKGLKSMAATISKETKL